MNKLFKLSMYLVLPLLSVMAVSCDDDDEPGLPPAPSISAVLPAEGLPGTVVTISGTNMKEVTSVKFGTTDAEAFNPANNTATAVTATVPMSMTPGTYSILVTSPGGSDEIDFVVLDDAVPPATITSFSPTEGPVGTEVTITGTNFIDDNIASMMLGGTEITTYSVAATGTTITFTVPEGAQTGTITITPVEGDPVVSSTEFTVTSGSGNRTLNTYSDIVVNAQGVRNDEGVVTAFSADGETFTLAQGVDPEVAPRIDFIVADSGGDDEIDLFTPDEGDWLVGNYFEDSDDMPVVWPTLNNTKMWLTSLDAAAFSAATAAEIDAMTGEGDPDPRVSEPDPGIVVLFETADGKKGLLLWKDHDPNADAGSKADIFTFDIKVLE